MGYSTIKPQPFIRATIDELALHCSTEHHDAWDSLRRVAWILVTALAYLYQAYNLSPYIVVRSIGTLLIINDLGFLVIALLLIGIICFWGPALATHLIELCAIGRLTAPSFKSFLTFYGQHAVGWTRRGNSWCHSSKQLPTVFLPRHPHNPRPQVLVRLPRWLLAQTCFCGDRCDNFYVRRYIHAHSQLSSLWPVYKLP